MNPPTTSSPRGLRRHVTAGGFNISAWSIEHPWVVFSVYTAIVALALMAIFGGLMPRLMSNRRWSGS
jgi:hypothetical protein